ncbi:hypothetical protein [Falsiroseomonas oryzae]|uniref:hypothetical protein n=1 Tax=Falsiroseomonas oryzae TaxID=2766473 RepID=UPI0022EB11C1|nr:hypothetical protein [Roseomonas sp. MO-31]
MSEGLGWLPVEAREKLEEEQDRASAAEAERLLALDPRARVLALVERAACRAAEDAAPAPLRLADLARVLESFPGAAPVDPAALAERFPSMLGPPA